MAKCPECGSEMVSKMKRKICEVCGLSLSGSEYDTMWDNIHDEGSAKLNPNRSRNREYLDWYQSSKK